MDYPYVLISLFIIHDSFVSRTPINADAHRWVIDINDLRAYCN